MKPERLTPETEKQARSVSRGSQHVHLRLLICALLAEIDALRAERAK